jgi:cytoskeleton protein RodZ
VPDAAATGREARELAEPLLAEVTPAGSPGRPATAPGQPAGSSAADRGLADAVAISNGDDRLRFSFVSDCWVEVRDESGALLYGNLGKAGALLELTGAGPFRILLGYAPGANLAFNGESVPLTPHTRNDVARLVLGQ